MIKTLKIKYIDAPVQVKASFWFVICSVLQKGISVITTPIFTRLLSSTDYGEYSVFVSWQGILAALIIITLPYGVFEQGLIKFSEKRKTFTSSLLGLMTTMVLIGFVLYFIFHNFFNNLFALNTIQMMAMFLTIWSSSVLAFWSMTQRVDYKYTKLVILTLIVSVAKPVVGIILVKNCADKVTARVVGLAVVEFCFVIWLFLSMMRKGKHFFSTENWKYALWFNIPLIPHYLSQRVLNSADRIMIERMVDASSAGIYSLAYSLALLLQLVNTAIRNSISPWTFKKIKNNQVGDIHKITYPAMIIVAVMNYLLIAFAPEIVRIFAPTEYYDAIWVIPPVTMSVFFMFLYTLFSDFEFYYEKTKFMSVATMIGAVVNIVLNFLFIKIFGYMAAGYTTLFCYFLYAVLHFIVMQRICKENHPGVKVYDLKLITLISIIFLFIGFFTMGLYTRPIIRYLLICLIIIVCKGKKRNILSFISTIRNDIQ